MWKSGGTENPYSQHARGYRKKAAEYSKGIRELYLDKVKGLIAETDYTQMAEDFAAQRSRLEKMVADGEAQLAEIEEQIAADGARRMPAGQDIKLERLNRETVDTLIEFISVGKRIPGTREVPVEIHWDF